MPCPRAILILVMGLAFCPLTRADRSVTLAWNPSPDTSVAGYVIHYGSDGTNYSEQVDAGANTVWNVTGLQAGGTNYFVVSAYDVNHNESPLSNPVEYIVPEAAETLTLTVAASPAQAGSVLGGGSFVTGSSVTVTASANTGYTFANWTANGTVQSASPSYTFTLATKLNLAANFTANSTSQTTNPGITTLAASDVTPTNATLNATANPNGSATTVYFEYGRTTDYGKVGATNTLASDLGDAQAVAQVITGLRPGTTLHFQAVAQNSLGIYFGGDLTFITPAAPPMLAAVPDQSVNVGSTLLVTNTVTEANVPPRGVTFSLGAGAPAGSALSPDGVFQWAPVREQGSTTNLITVWAVDDGKPALSNSVSFNVIVGACVQITIGSSVVPAGSAASVPVSLFSTVSLTNVRFSLATLAGRFTNWGAASGNEGMVRAAAQGSDPSQPQFNFTLRSGQLGATSLGTISVEALPAVASTFAPLTINGIAATMPGNTPAGPVFGQSGRLALIAGQPLLEVSLTNGSNPILALYGIPGSNCTVMSATNLVAPITWTPLTNLTLTTAVQSINPGSVAGQMEFFRVLQQ